MSAKTMAAVLARHQPAGDDIDDIPEGKIACGWIPCDFVIDDERDGEWRHEFAVHQQGALTAAGFGLVADPVVIHIHHDTEARARSFNEGYEAAMTQGLADDWFQEKLREAQAEALEEAADAAPGRHDNVCSAEECRDWAEWLRVRAATVRQAIPHQCESWQLQMKADGGEYCGACGKIQP